MADGSEKATLGGLRLAKVLVWLVYAYFILAVILLTLTFFLQLFAANPDADFTQWVYRAADRVLAPFWGIFPSIEGQSGSVLDFAVVFAIIMYGILALVLHALVEWLDSKIVEARHRRALALAPPTYAASVYGAPSQVSAPVSPAPSASGPQPSAAPPGSAGHWTAQQTAAGTPTQPAAAPSHTAGPTGSETTSTPPSPSEPQAAPGDGGADQTE